MAVRLSALRAGCPLPPGTFLALISVRGLVDPRAIARLEGLNHLKIQSPNREWNLRPSDAEVTNEATLPLSHTSSWRDV
jgi:hypothetical protein